MLEPSKAAELYHPSVTRVVACAALLQPISPTKTRIAHAFTGGSIMPYKDHHATRSLLLKQV